MFSGKLISTDRTGNTLKPIDSIVHPPQEIQFIFCVMPQNTLKAIIDYNPMGETDLTRCSSAWEFDTIGHIMNGEIYYRGDEIQILIEISKRRHVEMGNGQIITEKCMHPYIIQFNGTDDRTCLEFTLQHYERMGFLRRVHHSDPATNVQVIAEELR